MPGAPPLVSVILPTRDRPRLLAVALRCYAEQTYPERELIVVDDGDRHPVDPAAVEALGGRLVRVPPGTPLGAKLNEGAAIARGTLCQKMDDDDWYGPGFLAAMVDGRRAAQRQLCQPTLAFVSPFLFFDVARWELRRSIDRNAPGATLQFDRDDWARHPFRSVRRDEDVWFLLDHLRAGGAFLPIAALELYLAVRHTGSASDRGHTWTHQPGGQELDEYVRERPTHRTPEELLPGWALEVYRDVRRSIAAEPPSTPNVLILTPLKDAADELDGYVRRLESLSYPRDRVSLGFLESDSVDGTFEALQRRLPELGRTFRRAGAWKRDFGYRVPTGVHRGAEPIQLERRSVLARSRNHLLSRALDDEEWVLWLDVDVVGYPPDLIERLLATGKEIVQPHCVLEPGGATFDTNGWRGHGRWHLDDLRGEGELVELDAVGGTVLLVRADLHRDGLVFPPFRYGLASSLVRPGRGEVETEGLGVMARDMGHRAWGMPGFEVYHRDERAPSRPETR